MGRFWLFGGEGAGGGLIALPLYASVSSLVSPRERRTFMYFGICVISTGLKTCYYLNKISCYDLYYLFQYRRTRLPTISYPIPHCFVPGSPLSVLDSPLFCTRHPTGFESFHISAVEIVNST
jgi:hypothetical protein